VTSLARRRTGAQEELRLRHVPVASAFLERKELVHTLDLAVTKRVTIISAPPGSGKSSLLRAWIDRWSGRRPVALVSVEHDERDAQRFWSAVLDAIRSSAPSADPPPVATATGDVDQVVDAVLSELASHANPVVLIIDDLHELNSADAVAHLEQLVAVLPSSARLVLSSRRDPSLRLHQLRLAAEVSELRARDLRFTEGETRELLAASGISLSTDGAASLHRRTEGWAAGLRLAVISLSHHPDPERFVAEFSGTDRTIGEYLMAEMLDGQPGEVQSMLLRTSLVDRVNGELADLLTGGSGAERMLLELEDANAFVVSLGPERTWFRYHQLLAEFLRLELRRRAAHEVGDLHRKAARWLADHGEVVEAVRHTQAAGDWPEAAGLVAAHSFGWVLDGQAATISAVVRSFPQGAPAAHPDLALAHAAHELNHGSITAAAAQLTLAESHGQSAPPARRARLTVAIAALRLAMARRSGQFDEVIERAQLLDAASADGLNGQTAMDPELRAVALLNLGIAETWSGRLEDAERHLSEGAALSRAIGRPFLEVACRAHQGFPSQRVSVAAARERGRHAVSLAERYGLADQPILAPALGAIGTMAIWTGEFKEAEHWLGRAWEVAEPHVDPCAAMLLHLATGMLQGARAQHRAALREFTAAAQAEARLGGVHALAPWISGWLAATQARLGLHDEARATLAEFSGPQQSMRGMGAIDNARAVICLTDGDPAMALEALQGRLEVTHPTLSLTLVETHLLAGIAHLRLGEHRAAATAAEAALAAAEPDRLMFPFANTAAAELLEALPRHETAHAALLADVLDLLRGDPIASHDHARPSPQEELSASELRVLRYLPTNMTRVAIARELYLSVNTVNTHVRRIYSKLDACDRASAVTRARELRLLSTGRS
jgi:LuxR family transcriptional regulator, maltose regulon positive regulatory protein